MSPQDFLREKMEQLVTRFPTSKFQYEFDQFANFHIIQVWPISLYNGNNLYTTLESEISTEFDEQYFPGTVIFVSEESLNQVSSPQFEIKGKMFGINLIIKEVLQSFSFNAENYTCGENNYALAA